MDRVFNTGDEVVFRSWDDMVAEFGVDSHGCIPCKFDFVSDMKYLCGRRYSVESVYEDGEVDLCGFDEPFTISTDMLVHAEIPEALLPEISADDLFGVLCE